MKAVSIVEARLEDYAGVVPDYLLAEITQLSRRLEGLRMVHVNTTPVGGGVAEILKSLVPLLRSVGVDATWYALEPDVSFSRVCKTLHHCLQGDDGKLDDEEMELYMANNASYARELHAAGVDADLWIVHDVQLLPLLHYLSTASPGVWVCHVDATEPNKMVRDRLHTYMDGYRKIVVSMPEYRAVYPDSSRVEVFPPAISPMLPKHNHLAVHEAKKLLTWLGLDESRPLVSQVSRFDKWKDPWGVVDAYRLAREEIPGLQLALVGAMTAKDDHDALAVLASVQDYAQGDPDIHLFSNPLVIGDLEVNAFQSGSDVIVQKSTREGFGLTVTEAMWKGTPVVGGDCGGIRLQIRDGENGFLVTDVASCARRIVSLLKDRTLASALGNAARESVRESYLMPRLLKDYLNLSLAIVDSREHLYC